MLNILLIISSFYFSVKICKNKSKTKVLGFMLFNALMIFLYIYIVFAETPEFSTADIFPQYIFFMKSWFIWFALAALGGTINRASDYRTKRAFYILSFVLMGVFIFQSLRFMYPYSYDDLYRVTPSDYQVQTSQYTCGAASMVNLLKKWDIESTESEMAELSFTGIHGSVEEISTHYAVHKKLKGTGLKARISTLNVEELKNMKVPVILIVKAYWIDYVDHSILFLRYENNKFYVFDPDPAKGFGYYSEDFIEKYWRKTGVWIE